MAFDWKGLEQADRQRSDAIALWLGVGFVAMGILGGAVVLALGRPDKIVGEVIWLALGLVNLAAVAAGRWKRHKLP